jgi:hypothetical protein
MWARKPDGSNNVMFVRLESLIFREKLASGDQGANNRLARNGFSPLLAIFAIGQWAGGWQGIQAKRIGRQWASGPGRFY